MNPYRSGRAWVPAAVVALVFTVTLGVLQAIFRLVYDDSVSRDFEDSTVEWLLTTNIGFWGPDAFDIDQSRVFIAHVVAALVLLVITFLVALVALRGVAPGSSALSAFIISWAAVMVAAPVASVADMLVQSYDELSDGALGPWLSGAVSTSVYGFKWGWLAALIGTFVWIAVRPKPGAATATAPTSPDSVEDSVEDSDRPSPPTALPPPPTPRPAPPI